MTKKIGDLPPALVGEKILTKAPITSLGAVRSTCKSWEALSKGWILGGKAAATARHQQFVGFMTMDSKVCSLRFQLRKDQDLVDVSIKQVDLLNQVEISKAIPCNGLFLCVAKDYSRLVVWNPYLGQTRWIGPRTSFHRVDTYAFGYDMNKCIHKILRFLDFYDSNQEEVSDLVDLSIKHFLVFEIYDLSSTSWRVLDVTPDFEIEFYQRGRGASVKGNTYFFAQEKIACPEEQDMIIEEIEDFLLCFDFTRERFGPRLPLPFHSYNEETVAVSSVREERLAVLYQQGEDPFDALEIWVTAMIEPNAVSWMKFLKVDTMRPVPGLGFVQFDLEAGSFFIDEQERVAVVFDVDGYEPTKTARYNTAFIFGEDGYFKSVSLGEAPNVGSQHDRVGYASPRYSRPLVCSSSYLPSLVQINQSGANGKEMI